MLYYILFKKCWNIVYTIWKLFKNNISSLKIININKNTKNSFKNILFLKILEIDTFVKLNFILENQIPKYLSSFFENIQELSIRSGF